MAKPPIARIQSAAAARISGLSKRAVNARSLRGEIPSAAKLFGTWTFDPAKLAQFIVNEEARCKANGRVERMKDDAPPPRATSKSTADKSYAAAMSKLRGGTPQQASGLIAERLKAKKNAVKAENAGRMAQTPVKIGNNGAAPR